MVTPAPLKHPRKRQVAWWAGFITLLLVTWYWQPLRAYESLLVLADINSAAAPSHLKSITPPPTRTPIAYSTATGSHRGDLYLPGDGAPAAGIVLVPGVVPEGKNDPRLIALAHTLARARFAVLVPEMPGFREIRVRPSDAREVADAISHLAHRRDLAPQGRAGVISFSYAVGLAVLAGLEEDVRDKILFIVGVGGYHDLVNVVTFFTTGYFQEGGQWRHMQPNPYGKWVFVNSSEDYLHSPRDRAVLDQMVRLKLRDMRGDISHLAPQLGPEGRAIYDLLTNTDPARVASLMATLPAPVRADMANLTLAGKDLTRLKARLSLIADRNDNIIPYTESIALAHAVSETQVSLVLVGSLIHVEPKGWRYFSWEFWRQDLPDFWRMYRVVYALLGERERE
ncbi:MAG: alpha/beta hydrolase [Gammaproteobacteria bacterium]|nr:alpha/beta hydrolase [Gammaproteobacteria bacterium]